MSPVTRRIRILVIGLLLLHGVILVRVFAMQIIQGAHWEEKSDDQKYRRRRLVPRRGSILDRAGRALASEESGYSLVPRIRRRKGKVIRDNGRVWRCSRCLRTATLSAKLEPVRCRGCRAPGEAFEELTVPRPARYAEIARLTGRTPEEIDALIEKVIADCAKRMKDGSLRGPNPILKDIPVELARWLHLHPETCPDLEVVGARLRYNHHPAVMPHLVGVAGIARRDPVDAVLPEGQRRIDDPARLAPLGFKLFDVYRMTVGHSGLEKILDERLVGRMGIQDVILDHAGVVVHTTRDDEPTPGEDIRLTIDLELQREAERILDGCGRPAAFVALDPKTGEVLALATAPRFNVATLGAEFDAILADPGKPLVNRPVKTPALPGSVFKVVTAIAGMRAGTIDPSHTVNCTGVWGSGRWAIKCNAKYGHGPVGLLEALERSCNIYFIEAGLRMGAAPFEETCRLLGLGKPTGLQVAEASGTIPTVRSCGGDRNRARLRMISFGQGRVGTTPIQMAAVAALVANGGRRVNPSLIVGERPAPGAPVVNASALEPVREGMYRVVHGRKGTAKRFGLQKYDAAAKTGTAERGDGRGENNAWLIGFAPYHAPTVAFACYVEDTDLHGGDACGPLVAEWLATWKRWRDEGGR